MNHSNTGKPKRNQIIGSGSARPLGTPARNDVRNINNSGGPFTYLNEYLSAQLKQAKLDNVQNRAAPKRNRPPTLK